MGAAIVISGGVLSIMKLVIVVSAILPAKSNSCTEMVQFPSDKRGLTVRRELLLDSIMKESEALFPVIMNLLILSSMHVHEIEVSW